MAEGRPRSLGFDGTRRVWRLTLLSHRLHPEWWARKTRSCHLPSPILDGTLDAAQTSGQATDRTAWTCLDSGLRVASAPDSGASDDPCTSAKSCRPSHLQAREQQDGATNHPRPSLRLP